MLRGVLIGVGYGAQKFINMRKLEDLDHIVLLSLIRVYDTEGVQGVVKNINLVSFFLGS